MINRSILIFCSGDNIILPCKRFTKILITIECQDVDLISVHTIWLFFSYLYKIPTITAITTSIGRYNMIVTLVFTLHISIIIIIVITTTVTIIDLHA